MHGGILEIASEEGVGTSVAIRLPLCSTLEAEPDRAQNTPEIQKLLERNRE